MELTDKLHEACKASGLRYTEGYMTRDGESKETDTVTAIWPDDDPMHTLTFEEYDGALFCVDDMSIEQCIGAVMAR